MPDPVTALVVGGSQLVGSFMQADAAGEAAGIQAGASQAGIQEQRRQFNELQKLMKPYVDIGKPAMAGYAAYAKAGPKAFEQQQALTGLLGPERQKEAIAQIEQSGGFQASVQAGEEALLQKASATGGLRGGNIQAALSQFRPQMLQAEIERQYGRLGGFSDIGRETQANLLKIGQASAAGVGAQGVETGTNVANLLAQQGAARAGGELGEAKAYGQLFNLPAQMLGFQYGSGGKAGFGSLFG
jgi:hypothetical protein